MLFAMVAAGRAKPLQIWYVYLLLLAPEEGQATLVLVLADVADYDSRPVVQSFRVPSDAPLLLGLILHSRGTRGALLDRCPAAATCDSPSPGAPSQQMKISQTSRIARPCFDSLAVAWY